MRVRLPDPFRLVDRKLLYHYGEYQKTDPTLFLGDEGRRIFDEEGFETIIAHGLADNPTNWMNENDIPIVVERVDDPNAGEKRGFYINLPEDKVAEFKQQFCAVK